MLDIDYCNGRGCPKSNICQRYANFLYKLEKKQDVRYARGGTLTGECEQFDAKRFTGN